MKKIFLLFLSVLFCFSAVACGPGSGGSGYIEDVAIDTDYEGSLKISYLPGDPGELEILYALRDSFEDKYPNIRTTLAVMSGTNYLETLSKQAAGETIGDIIWCSDEYVTMVAEKNYLEDLTPYLAQEKINFDYSLYDANMMKLGKSFTEKGQYFLPRDYTQAVLVVNKQIFAEVQAAVPGLEMPGNDITMDELYELCGQIQPYLNAHKPNNLQRYAFNPSMFWQPVVHSAVTSYGAEIISEEGKLAVNDETKEAYDTLKRFADAGYIDQLGNASFTRGETVFAVTTKTHITKILNMTYKDEEGNVKPVPVDFLPYPVTGNDGANYIPCGTSGYGMFSKSNHKREAIAFLLHMMSEEGQIALAQSKNAIPIMNSFLTDPEKIALWEIEANGEKLNSEAFIYNKDRVCLNDLLKDVDRFDDHTEVINGILEMFKNYVKGTTWSQCVSDLESKIGKFMNK